jgi:hypothetical protein
MKKQTCLFFPVAIFLAAAAIGYGGGWVRSSMREE